MIDKTTFIATIIDISSKCFSSDGNITIGKTTLVPILCPKARTTTKHQALVKNLLFTLKGDVLIISNSLHKFHKGNNYSDFSFLDLQVMIREIENLTGINAEYFEIRKLEFALNIETINKPYLYLPMFSDYKGKEFDKMKTKTGFWYGNKYKLSEYALKVYDKSEMIKRNEGIKLELNLLRFETEYSRVRKIPNIKTLADLKNKDNLQIIFNELINQVERLNCIGNEDFSNVSSRDREMYFAGQASRFWIAENMLNKETAKDKKKRYKAIQQKVSKKNLIEEFTKKLKQKFSQLIQS